MIITQYEELVMRRAVSLRILVVCALFAFVYQPARAERASREEMDRVCRNWLFQAVSDYGPWAGTTEPTVGLASEITADGEIVALCYSVIPRGFVIVPVLKEMPPIKAYSQDSDIDIHDAMGLPALLRELVVDRAVQFKKLYGSLDASQQAARQKMFDESNGDEWKRLLAESEQFSSACRNNARDLRGSVGPLLTSSWHQHWPYNIYSPYGDGDLAVVGCVATAMAQLMKYHEWPPYGVGDHSYYWAGDTSCDSSTPGATLGCDFSDPYDWDNMLDSCSGCSVDEQEAMAELSYEAGISVNMNFGACGSGAYMGDAANAMSVHFSYGPYVSTADRSYYTSTTWFQLIQSEINADRPMLYSFKTTGAGHAIVCDGWRDTGGLKQYHMNYGWGGSNNAWYTVDQLAMSVSIWNEDLIKGLEPEGDCNGNRQYDSDDIAGGVSEDCQGNGIPDECELVGNDCNGNNVPDECDAAAIVTQQPAHCYGCLGEAAVFSVGITGADSYRWYKDGDALYDGAFYSGTATPQLTILSFDPTDEGEYYCHVTAGCLSFDSDSAILQEAYSPLITGQPASSSTTCAGNTASFNVTVEGQGFTYSWSRDGIMLYNDGHVSGAFSGNLLVNNVNVDDVGTYVCRVTNPCGVYTDSQESELNLELAFEEDPQDTCAELGSAAAFSATAVVSPPQTVYYYWRKGTEYLSDGGNISGAATDTLVIDPVSSADAGDYSVTAVSNNCIINSAEATLDIGGCPSCPAGQEGDLDGDGDRDLMDLQAFLLCFGVDVTVDPSCACANVDDSNYTVDYLDWSAFEAIMSGPD